MWRRHVYFIADHSVIALWNQHDLSGFFYYIKQRNQCIFHSEPVSFFKTWFDARNKKLSSTESPMLFRVNLITKKNMHTSEEKIINL